MRGQQICFDEDTTIVLGETLGVGSSGSVYKAHHKDRPEEVYAVKLIDTRQMQLAPSWERERDKLLREVRILTSISHTCVVNLYGVVNSDTHLALLMDLVPKGELFLRVCKRPMNEECARYVFIQLVLALDYLHVNRVMHRDVKLENVLVSEELTTFDETGEELGPFCIVKLADFGLSKDIYLSSTSRGNGSHSPQWFTATSYVGTPQYWAPEIIKAGKGGGSYTHAADLWSLGCLLYVLVGGRYPFDVTADTENPILKGQFTMNSRAFSSVSEECKDIIRGLLTVDVSKRLTIAEIKEFEWFNRPFPHGIQLPMIAPRAKTWVCGAMGPLFEGAGGRGGSGSSSFRSPPGLSPVSPEHIRPPPGLTRHAPSSYSPMADSRNRFSSSNFFSTYQSSSNISAAAGQGFGSSTTPLHPQRPPRMVAPREPTSQRAMQDPTRRGGNSNQTRQRTFQTRSGQVRNKRGGKRENDGVYRQRNVVNQAYGRYNANGDTTVGDYINFNGFSGYTSSAYGNPNSRLTSDYTYNTGSDTYGANWADMMQESDSSSASPFSSGQGSPFKAVSNSRYTPSPYNFNDYGNLDSSHYESNQYTHNNNPNAEIHPIRVSPDTQFSAPPPADSEQSCDSDGEEDNRQNVETGRGPPHHIKMNRQSQSHHRSSTNHSSQNDRVNPDPRVGNDKRVVIRDNRSDSNHTRTHPNNHAGDEGRHRSGSNHTQQSVTHSQRNSNRNIGAQAGETHSYRAREPAFCPMPGMGRPGLVANGDVPLRDETTTSHQANEPSGPAASSGTKTLSRRAKKRFRERNNKHSGETSGVSRSASAGSDGGRSRGGPRDTSQRQVVASEESLTFTNLDENMASKAPETSPSPPVSNNKVVIPATPMTTVDREIVAVQPDPVHINPPNRVTCSPFTGVQELLNSVAKLQTIMISLTSCYDYFSTYIPLQNHVGGIIEEIFTLFTSTVETVTQWRPHCVDFNCHMDDLVVYMDSASDCGLLSTEYLTEIITLLTSTLKEMRERYVHASGLLNSSINEINARPLEFSEESSAFPRRVTVTCAFRGSVNPNTSKGDMPLGMDAVGQWVGGSVSTGTDQNQVISRESCHMALNDLIDELINETQSTGVVSSRTSAPANLGLGACNSVSDITVLPSPRPTNLNVKTPTFEDDNVFNFDRRSLPQSLIPTQMDPTSPSFNEGTQRLVRAQNVLSITVAELQRCLFVVEDIVKQIDVVIPLIETTHRPIFNLKTTLPAIVTAPRAVILRHTARLLQTSEHWAQFESTVDSVVNKFSPMMSQIACARDLLRQQQSLANRAAIILATSQQKVQVDNTYMA